VRCDDTNNPPADVANGQLVMDIGVAPTDPAEFVVLRIGKTREEIRVLDPVLAQRRRRGGHPMSDLTQPVGNYNFAVRLLDAASMLVSASPGCSA